MKNSNIKILHHENYFSDFFKKKITQKFNVKLNQNIICCVPIIYVYHGFTLR